MGRKTASTRKVLWDGSIEWRNAEGKLHREDGPAREWPDQKAWAWYRNGRLHREDGPATDGNLGQSWHLNGKRHRIDGPAVEYVDGRKQWYRHGKELTEAEFNALREREVGAITAKKKELKEIEDRLKKAWTMTSRCQDR